MPLRPPSLGRIFRVSVILWTAEPLSNAICVKVKTRWNPFIAWTAALKKAAKLALRPGVINVAGPPCGKMHQRTIQRLQLRFGVAQNCDESQFLRRCQWTKALNPAFPNFNGNLGTARYLFVGDRINQIFRWPHPPFYAQCGCVPWLNAQLDIVGIPEHDIVWMNSNNVPGMDDDDVSRDLVEIMATKPKLKVVTLGNVSTRIVKKIGIVNPVAINHPQWAKRFHYHDGLYIQQLAKLL